MILKKIISDEEFMKWALAFKPCRYCGIKFVGPVCACEKRKQRAARYAQVRG